MTSLQITSEQLMNIMNITHQKDNLSLSLYPYIENDYYTVIENIDNVITRLYINLTGVEYYHVNLTQFIYECILDNSKDEHCVLVDSLRDENYTCFYIMQTWFNDRYKHILDKIKTNVVKHEEIDKRYSKDEVSC